MKRTVCPQKGLAFIQKIVVGSLLFFFFYKF